jgi:hypothetical protein
VFAGDELIKRNGAGGNFDGIIAETSPAQIYPQRKYEKLFLGNFERGSGEE